MTRHVYAIAQDEAEATSVVEEGKTIVNEYESNILLIIEFTHSITAPHSVVISEVDHTTIGCLSDDIFDG